MRLQQARKCSKCNEPCEVLEKHWQEPDEAWGASCWRDCYEDESECCHAEVEEIEHDERQTPSAA